MNPFASAEVPHAVIRFSQLLSGNAKSLETCVSNCSKEARKHLTLIEIEFLAIDFDTARG